MKRETAVLLADTFMGVLSDLGLDVEELLSFVLAAPLDQATKDFAVRAQRDGLAHELETLPDWTPEEISEALATAERMKTAVEFTRHKLKEILKGLPRTPNGPARVIVPEDELRVCAEVDALLLEGYGRRLAAQTAANRRDVSLRSIYRVLQKHGKTQPRSRKTAVK